MRRLCITYHRFVAFARRLTPSPRSSDRISAVLLCVHAWNVFSLFAYICTILRDTQTGDTLHKASHLHKLYSAHIMSAHRDVHNKHPQHSLMWPARVCVRVCEKDTVSNENFNSFKVVARLPFTPGYSQKSSPKKWWPIVLNEIYASDKPAL